MVAYLLVNLYKEDLFPARKSSTINVTVRLLTVSMSTLPQLTHNATTLYSYIHIIFAKVTYQRSMIY